MKALFIGGTGTISMAITRQLAENPDWELYLLNRGTRTQELPAGVKTITADINKIPAVDTLSDAELPALMDMPEARQLLHITYGPILCGELRERFFKAMHKFEAEYEAALEKHFDKHLTLLGVPAK